MRTIVLALLTLLAADHALAAPGETGYVQERVVLLRTAPGEGASVLMPLERGRAVVERERRAGWLRIAVIGLIGAEGWVAETAIGATPPVAGGAPGFDEARAGIFLLDLDGTAGLAFRADCRAITADGNRERLRLTGELPRRLTIEGTAVSCSIAKREGSGVLLARLSDTSGLVAAADTNGRFGGVRVRSEGPWGGAIGTRGGERLTLGRPPGASTPPTLAVPPLNGNPVPPLSGNPVPPILPSP